MDRGVWQATDHGVTELDISQVTSVVSDSLQPHGHEPTRLLCPWDPPGKNTGVGCHLLLQGIFPTQGLSPSPADLPDPRIEPGSPALQADSLPAEL